MSPAHISAIVGALGLIANLAWTVVNLRIENALIRKLDELKTHISQQYVCFKVCDERHEDILRRLTHLEQQ
jgi:hypothetical protein